jgi:hypothetical protein
VESEKRAFLEELRNNGGNIALATRTTGTSRDTVYSWRRRDPTFDAAVFVAKGRAELPPLEKGQVPDFLQWREDHIAYLQADKSIKRAQNFWYQTDWIQKMESSTRLIMVLHPGAGKTTSVSEYVTWNIMRDRNFRATIIRANEDEARKNVGAIGRKLEHDDYHWALSEMPDDDSIRCPVCEYGGRDGFTPQLHGSKRRVDDQWSRGAFTVSGRTSGDKEPTVQAYGANSPIAGVRSDLIVLDDAQDPGKYRTSGYPHSEKMFDWFREDVLARLYDHQKLVVIGNRLGSQDFVGKLIAEYGPEDPDDPKLGDWTVVYYPAVLDDEKRRVLVPELWSYDALARKRKEVGEEVWAFQWQQQEVDDSSATFQKAVLDSCKNYDRIIGEETKATDVVLGIDPALKQYCAMVVLGLDRQTGKRYLLDYHNERGMGTIDNLVARAESLVVDFGVKTCVIETNNTQQTFYQAVRERLAPHGVRCVAYNTVTATGASAEQTDFTISSIADLMADRLVDLPYGDKQTQAKTDLLCQQFQLWVPKPPGRSSWHLTRDIVMAWLFAESEVRKLVRYAKKDISQRRSDAPDWTKNRSGGWAWQRPRRTA